MCSSHALYAEWPLPNIERLPIAPSIDPKIFVGSTFPPVNFLIVPKRSKILTPFTSTPSASSVSSPLNHFIILDVPIPASHFLRSFWIPFMKFILSIVSSHLSTGPKIDATWLLFHFLAGVHLTPVHASQLRICLAKLLAWLRISITLPSPPSNQLIPSNIGCKNPSSILNTLFNIPETNCSTAQRGPLIIFVIIFSSIFLRKPNISPNNFWNKHHTISIIFINAFLAAGPKKKSRGLNFLLRIWKILNAPMIFLIIPVRALLIIFFIIPAICFAVLFISNVISTISLVRGFI